MTKLVSKVPEGHVSEKWTNHKFNMKLVNPANKRRFTVIVVGTGLAGASAAASLGELGYNVLAFCIHDSPRRAPRTAVGEHHRSVCRARGAVCARVRRAARQPVVRRRAGVAHVLFARPDG